MRSVDSNLGFGSNSVFKTEKQSERETREREREIKRLGSIEYEARVRCCLLILSKWAELSG